MLAIMQVWTTEVARRAWARTFPAGCGEIVPPQVQPDQYVLHKVLALRRGSRQ